MNSTTASIFVGDVYHTRNSPKKHHFTYPFKSYFLKLPESEEETNSLLQEKNIKGRFVRKNYFDLSNNSLPQTVLKKASDLNAEKITGDVFFLGQLSNWGLYFSPVNFYFIKTHDHSTFTYMVAEVTNTPWGEKHCYLVNLASPALQEKHFHVSPFHPMDMTYQWLISSTDEFPPKDISLHIKCFRKKEEKDFLEFQAGFKLSQSQEKTNSLTCLKIMLLIYLQAIFLKLKKLPFYSNPSTSNPNLRTRK